MKYGHFEDASRSFVITDPLTPKPWSNYLGNRSLKAFITQNAGGMLCRVDPLSQRITRYHHTIVPPGDRPGFYVYLRDRQTGKVWNPHFAPTCTPLDKFECRHSLGVTKFTAEKDGVRAHVTYTIPPEHDAFIMQVCIENIGTKDIDLEAVSYLEFGLLDPGRETWWSCLQYHFSFLWDAAINAVRWDYHVYEAPVSPRMVFGCSASVSGFEFSRDAFIGPTGSLERPQALSEGKRLGNSELPEGGHGAGTIGVDVKLAPGQRKEFSYIFAIGDTWDEAIGILKHYQTPGAAEAGIASTQSFWSQRLNVMQVETGDEVIDRWVNIWNPYNATMVLELGRGNGYDRAPLGLQYRDTTQDALAVANLDPEFSLKMMREVFAQQGKDGSGCFSFWPGANKQELEPRRSDNTVWQIYTLHNLAAETGDLEFFGEKVRFRDGGEASIYDHVLLGLKYIHDRPGKNGLPMRFYADWNDGLAVLEDPTSESVMLAMQMIHSCKLFREIAQKLGRPGDAAWCDHVIADYTHLCNSDLVWDGDWYRRVLLTNGKFVGSSQCSQGKIYINSQSWAVVSGVGNQENRGIRAMDSLAKHLATDFGVSLCAPPFAGFPEPNDPPRGSLPGANENGGILFHANTWVIIAEAMLGRPELAMQYFRRIIPEQLATMLGEDRFQGEPYCVCSNIAGPVHRKFGVGNSSWLSGTANWIYIAATQYLFGIRPTLEGLQISPCLPASYPRVRIRRRFRGTLYNIQIDNRQRSQIRVFVGGRPIDGTLVRPTGDSVCDILCEC